MGFLDRFRRTDKSGEPAVHRTVVEIDATSLSRVFSAPVWLRDLGLLAWFLVGVSILLVGLVALLGVTSTIVDPVIVGAILATVAGPLVTKMQGRGIPRAGGAAIVVLALLALAAIIVLLVFGGIVEQSSEIKAAASEAVDKVQDWMNDLGAGGTSGASDNVQSTTSQTGKTLLEGVAQGIQGLTSFVFFLTFSVFATFFLLKDGPTVRRFIDRNLGVPAPVATVITGNVMQSLRRYFLGVTFVAAFNAVVVGLAAVLLDVPLAGTIAVVVFVTAYIPFLGAFISGAFAVILTLSSQGTTAALIMLVAVILANGLLQNIFQPIAFGATLDLNPLVVLIVTIGFGSLFGMVGLVLGAPLTSAAIHISRDLAAAKSVESAAESAAERPPQPDDPLSAF
ncbi:MAG TPA: AI-2E family transporter [Gaiellaceae bacterium]|nr:AI-2E family transporter [Gaiellaceae bacterium]